MRVKNGVAVVTGGIGFSLTKQLLSKGCCVSVCDVSDERLVKAQTELNALVAELSKRSGVKVKYTCHRVDVTKRDQVESFAMAVIEEFGKVSILFNNAGVVAANTLEQSSWEEIDLVLNVNINGVVNCTKVFMPYLSKEKEAYVVNVSSLEGIIAIPGDITYCTSKFAVRGFSEALMLDNMITKPHVKVMCVHPGMVQTNMLMNNKERINPNALGVKGYEKYTDGIDVPALSNGFKKIGSTTPDAAASQILNALYRNRSRCLVGTDCLVLDFLFRIFPRLLYNKFLYFPTIALVLALVKMIGKKSLLVCGALMVYRKFTKR